MSSREPQQFQNAARQLFRNLTAVDADAIWLLLLGLAHSDDGDCAILGNTKVPSQAKICNSSTQSSRPFRHMCTVTDIRAVRQPPPHGRSATEFRTNTSILLAEAEHAVMYGNFSKSS